MPFLETPVKGCVTPIGNINKPNSGETPPGPMSRPQSASKWAGGDYLEGARYSRQHLTKAVADMDDAARKKEHTEGARQRHELLQGSP